MREPVVWILSNEQWPRAMLRAELIERGYDAVGFLTIEDALHAIYGRAKAKPGIIILDLHEIEISRAQLSALASRNIPIFLVGGLVELNDPLLGEFPWAGIFRRPFLIGDVAAAIERVLPAQALDPRS